MTEFDHLYYAAGMCQLMMARCTRLWQMQALHLVACLLFAAYGRFIGATPIVLVNSVMALIMITRLVMHHRSRRVRWGP